MPSIILAQRIKDVLGILSLLATSRDVYLLLLTWFICMCAYSSSTLVLALYFAALGHSDTKIGLFLSLMLVGDVGVSLLLTLVADSLGRRCILISRGLLMTLSSVVFATTSNYWILLLAAIVGVISPSGNEIGPFRAIEESALAQLSDPKTRTDIFAFYVFFRHSGWSQRFLDRWTVHSSAKRTSKRIRKQTNDMQIFGIPILLLASFASAQSNPSSSSVPTGVQSSHHSSDIRTASSGSSGATHHQVTTSSATTSSSASHTSASKKISSGLAAATAIPLIAAGGAFGFAVLELL